jgi:hypothetical protein
VQGTEHFRRGPNGLDRHGALYYIFNFFQTSGAQRVAQ